MEYTKGQIVHGTINKVSSKGVYIKFENNDGYGFLPSYHMTDVDEKGEILLKRFQKLSIAIEKLKNESRNFYIVSQIRYSKILKKIEQEKQKAEQLGLFNSIVAPIHPGNVIECKIIKASTNKIQLNVGGYENVFVEKDEIAWGNQDAKNQSYCEGQIVDAVFLYANSESRTLFFSLKRLRKNPYEEDLYSYDTEKLLAFLGIKKNLFVGKCVRKKEHVSFLVDIISYNNQKDEELEGELLVNPYTGANLKALFKDQDSTSLVDGNYYQVTLVAAPTKYRKENNEPFVFSVSSFSKFEENPYKFITNEVFKKSDNPHSNTTIARLLEEVGKQMYSSKDRTFFELLQNADDAAAPKSENSVEVVVKTYDNCLLFCHNGCAFSRSDFVSISSAANSTKRKQGNKTGYKGIGFKSVFSDADSVHLLSRGFNIKFEKNNPLFRDFHSFYYKARNCRSEEDYNRIMAPFRDDEKSFRGISDMPWQILPLWENNNDIFSSVKGDYNVCIGIKTKVVNLYEESIKKLAQQPEFLLFLRNTKRLNLFGKVIEKSLTLGKIVLRSDSQTKRYIKRDFSDISVTNAEFKKYPSLHLQIREVHNLTTGEKELHFFEKDQDKSSTIPNKLAESGITTISFVSNVEEECIVPREVNKASYPLFAYLPTSDQRFAFPFYVNADFVLSSNRESVQGDNPWNVYLFAKIASCLVRWVSEVASVNQPNYLNLLVSKLFDEKSSDAKYLASSFNCAYIEALRSQRFILNDCGEKVSCNQILIDKSGLSSFISSDSFYTLTRTSKRLPHSSLDATILEEDIFGIEKITKAKIYQILTENIEIVRLWILSTDEESRQQFFVWLSQDENNAVIISSIPFIQFGKQWFSTRELADKANHIVSTQKTFTIKDVLSKLGIVCSDTIIDSHPLAGNTTTMEEKSLFALIKDKDTSLLSFQDRFRLVECCEKFNNVGEAAIANWPLFRNQKGSFVKMASMFAYREYAPVWLHDYMLKEDECHVILNKFLVRDENILPDIVEPNILDILKSTDVYEIYSYFKNRWTNGLTQKLIDQKVSNVISLVEVYPETNVKYIQSILQLSLSSSSVYSEYSLEYRIIKIASSDSNCINPLRSKITIDGIPLLSISLKDEFHVLYNNKQYEFHLSQILTSYSDSLKLSTVANNFTNIVGADSIFAQNEANPKNVYRDLFANTICKSVQLNVEQFCFIMLLCQSTHYNFISFRDLRNYIRVSDEQWFVNVLEYCLYNDLGEALYACLQTPGISYPCGSLSGKFIDSDEYTLSSERVPSFVSSWADTENKKKFLKKLGVYDKDGNDIQRRITFKANKIVNDYWNISDSKIIRSFLEWVKSSVCLPVQGDNQVAILEKLFASLRIAGKHCEDDFSNSSEWSNQLYLAWKKESGITIKIISGLLPYRGICDNLHFFNAQDGEYYYFSSSKTIYLSSTKEAASILTDVYSDRTIPFEKDDWNSIFLVSANVVNDKDAEIEELKLIIEELRSYKRSDNQSEIDEHGKVIEKNDTDEISRAEINRQARVAAKEFLSSLSDYDCDEWDAENSYNIITDKIKYKGKTIVVVVCSSQSRKLYLHPRAFAELMQDPDNLLLNYAGDHRIYSLSFDDIFMDNPNVNIVFDTDIVTPSEIVELANKYMYSKKTCFVIENPKHSQSDAISSFGLNEKKNDGKVEIFNLEDIFD